MVTLVEYDMFQKSKVDTCLKVAKRYEEWIWFKKWTCVKLRLTVKTQDDVRKWIEANINSKDVKIERHVHSYQISPTGSLIRIQHIKFRHKGDITRLLLCCK